MISTPIRELGYMNPAPRVAGTRKKKYDHDGSERCRQVRRIAPITRRVLPTRRTGYMRPVRFMISPVATAAIVSAREGRRRRDPAVVAVLRRTV